MNKDFIFRLDWTVILIYFSFLLIGIISIYSSTYEENNIIFFSSIVGKQILFCISSILIGILILNIKPGFFQQVSFIIYILSIISLIGLFLIGDTAAGSTSWYKIGTIKIQPSEFAKISTALMIASYFTNIQTDITKTNSLIKALLIILIPSILIISQRDPGSAIVFSSFILVFFREGLPIKYLFLIIVGLILFVLTLVLSIYLVFIIIILSVLVQYFFIKKYNSKTKFNKYFLLIIAGVTFCLSVNFIFNSVFEQRHRDRFNVILGITEDIKGVGYNINQSKIAIGSGGLIGKGFLQGTQTKGNFVPAQHTDYIFTNIAEEWGFIGSMVLILLFLILILRILDRGEKQKNIFNRVFIYCIASLITFHFIINIGMSLGLLPTIGIPLPFISYGGSSMLSFSILIFLYLNFDVNRFNQW
ncbi:MAG: rod shape-determining protein RodA [Flavobacteriaceae bacterium]|nr:rod shape-determining protein RodA [Flavobacteriaceae bacterium]